MAITDPLVLPADVTIAAVRTLSRRLRSRLGAGDDDFAISRARGRAPARIIAPAGAALLEEFRTPRMVSDVILAIAGRDGTDADTLLADAFPLLHDCFTSRFLVPAASSDAEPILAALGPGDRVGTWIVARCMRVLDDTELYQGRTRGGQLVAIKLARSPATPTLRRMFAREAAVLQHLGGIGAPRLLGAGRCGGRPYLAMRWCAGAEPGAALAEARAGGPAALRPLAARIAGAYARLHGRGVLHGDVCPGNLLIDRRGRVTLLDFGRARFITSRRGGWEPPRGFVPPLVDPELARAIADGSSAPLTGAGEQFAVAALLYLLVTGQYHQDFSMDRSRMLEQAARGAALPFPARGTAPWPALEAALERALRLRPDERHSSMRSFARAVARARIPDAPKLPARPASSERLIAGFIEDMARCRPLERIGAAAPVASVTYGMAGVACALYRLALIRQDARALAAADLWIAHAIAARSRPDAFHNRAMGLTPRAIGNVSPYHTASGVDVVDGLIAQAMGDNARYRAAADRFAAAARARCTGRDLTLGRAGVLIGAALLLDACPAGSRDAPAGLVALGNAAQGELLRRGAPPPGEMPGESSAGIAHGDGGIAYAILRWTRSAGAPVPAEVDRVLDRLAALAQPDGRGVSWPRAGGDPQLGDDVPGWCNGPAGMVHLWTAAHRWSGRAVHRELAESSAWAAWDAPGGYPDLCCGLAGRAYALLALYRHTGDADWLRRARLLGARAGRALERAGEMPYPLSLFKGAPGILLLLADLARPESACMPFFEAEGWPAFEPAP
ncbi:MAG TPA: lanthionine synthetase LanC family protein [Gemmatimonadales bacterium]|nr:lanthionine synthetase LanC family protein [Gemmatimonadales bacterium]